MIKLIELANWVYLLTSFEVVLAMSTYTNCLYVSDKTKTDMVTCTEKKKKAERTYMAVFYIPTQPVAKCAHDQIQKT